MHRGILQIERIETGARSAIHPQRSHRDRKVPSLGQGEVRRGLRRGRQGTQLRPESRPTSVGGRGVLRPGRFPHGFRRKLGRRREGGVAQGRERVRGDLGAPSRRSAAVGTGIGRGERTVLVRRPPSVRNHVRSKRRPNVQIHRGRRRARRAHRRLRRRTRPSPPEPNVVRRVQLRQVPPRNDGPVRQLRAAAVRRGAVSAIRQDVDQGVRRLHPHAKYSISRLRRYGGRRQTRLGGEGVSESKGTEGTGASPDMDAIAA
mmetsp:Transcript_21599/g.43656  ORF Transcript_21599/g.43656 Transcript_21599/m.43656 type:complete len:260 (+) Transcript_21599:313-1092(+)